MIKNLTSKILALFIVLAMTQDALGSGRKYSLKDLGELVNLPAENKAKVNGLNNSGHVIGANVTSGEYRAFLYTNGWMNLGTLGGSESVGSGINSLGVVVGHSRTTNGVKRAFLWTPNGTNGVTDNPQMEDLGTFPGGTSSEAVGINGNGQITGFAQTSSAEHAFRFLDGVMTDVGSLLTNLPYSYGFSINDTGHIVGIAYDEYFLSSHAFFYDGTSAIDIGSLSALDASAMAVNNQDHIVGYSTLASYFVHAFHYFDGVMNDIGTLGGHYSYALDINNSNVIVGGSFIDESDSVYHAFVFEGNKMLDLNTLLDESGTSWELVDARSINDSGQIIGNGQFNGVTRAFILSPLPEITSARISGADFLISFTTIEATRYSVESSEELAGHNWSTIITNVIGNGGIVTVTNLNAVGPKRFYRIGLNTQ